MIKFIKVFSYNLLPQLIALLFIPIIIKNIGETNYGLITLFLTLLAQLSIVDLGISRYLFINANKKNNSEIFINSIIISVLLGVFISFVFYFFSDELLNLLNIKVNIYKNLSNILILFVFINFLTIINSVLKSFLEGKGEIVKISFIRNLFSSTLFILIASISFLSKDLLLIFQAWLILCVLELIIIIKFYLRLSLSINLIQISFTNIRNIINISFFFFISNSIGPMLVNLERYYITGYFSIEKLAIYTLAFTLTSRLFMVNSTFQPFLLKRFAHEKSLNLKEYCNIIFLIIFISTSIFSILYKYFINVWLFEYENIEEVKSIVSIICLGIYSNSLARVPYDYLHSIGKNKLTSLIHIIEIPITLMLYTMASIFLKFEYLIYMVSIRYFLEFIVLMHYMFKYSIIEKKYLIKSTSLEFILIFLLLVFNNHWYSILIITLIILYIINTSKKINFKLLYKL